MNQRYLKTLFLLLLMLSLLLFSTACQGGQDADGGTGGEGNSDGGTGGEPVIPDVLQLVENGQARFRTIATSELSLENYGEVKELISSLRESGIEVDDVIRDSKPENVFDCEIIFGTGARHRGEECCVEGFMLGEDGYVIKVVGNRVIVAGGSEGAMSEAIRVFKSAAGLGKDDATDVAIRKDYYKLKETEYLISSIKVGEVDLSEYTLIYDVGNAKDKYGVKDIFECREDVYENSGIWLDIGKAENAAEYPHKFIFRCTEDAGERGFRAYVDGAGDIIMECAYHNAFDKSYRTVIDELIGEAIGDVSIPLDYEKKINVTTVKYSDFGAVGDGRTDDWQAIYDTHVYANMCGQKVYGDADATYFIHEIPAIIPVQTDVDFNGAVFLIDDRGSEVYITRTLDLFRLVRDNASKSLSKAYIAEELPNAELKMGDTSVPWLVPYLDSTSLVRFTNNHKDFIRHGGNINSGNARTDVLLIYEDGTISSDTPVAFDFVKGTQKIDTGRVQSSIDVANFTSIVISRIDDKPITVENGFFLRHACEVVADTDMNNKYHAHARGIAVERANATVKNLTHRLASEPYLPTSGYGWNDDGTKLSQSYPYSGFIRVTNAYNTKVLDCNLTGHTVYYEDKSASSSTPVPMGSYDLVIEYSSHVYLEGLTNGVDICDTQYWGIMASNGSKNMTFKDCSMSRFDAHRGFWNAELIGCEFGFNINVIGGGKLVVRDTVKVAGASFISLRGDYGASFRGDIDIINCTIQGNKSYRGGTDSSNYGKMHTTLYLIQSGYSSNYKGKYVEGNASAYPYLKWDFGYTCYMPQNIYVENMVVGNAAAGAKLYMFNNLADAMFVKPSDFVQTGEVAEELYYNQYQITKSITYKGMEPLQMSPSKRTQLWSIPVYTLE